MGILNETGGKGKPAASGVGVLDKSVEILALLAEDRSTSLAGVVEATGIPRPTAHRLLAARWRFTIWWRGVTEGTGWGYGLWGGERRLRRA